MKIALIENDQNYLDFLKSKISEYGWDVACFPGSKEFGTTNLREYDVVVSDYNLPSINGRDLINSIAGKTDAQMFLMGEDSTSFSEEDVENSYINGLIYKGHPDDLFDQLKYIDSKIRINKLMTLENSKINGLLKNGHTYWAQDKAGILEIRELPSEETMGIIKNEIAESDVNGVIVYFTNCNIISSIYLTVLVNLYKNVKKKNYEMAFWDNSEDKRLSDVLQTCNLDNLYSIYFSLEDAIKEINKM